MKTQTNKPKRTVLILKGGINWERPIKINGHEDGKVLFGPFRGGGLKSHG